MRVSNINSWLDCDERSLQLPYLEDGDRKIVQSNAIMRYIARKHNLCKYCAFTVMNDYLLSKLVCSSFKDQI